MNTLKRLLCSIIALALWVSCCVSAFAEDINRTNVYKVSAVSNVINYTADIFLLERNKQVYISEYEAELVTGYKIVKNERGTFCSKNGISSVVNCNSIDVDDQVFFDLFELMNALRVEYKFFEDSGTLSFIAPLYTPQELTDECYNVFGGNYGVTFLDNNYGIPLAAIYNIIGGFKYIEYFSGQYQQKQYEKALCNIITVEEDNSIFKLLDDTDEVSGNLSMVKELAGSLIDDKDYLANIFGWDVSDYIEFYDWAKEELKQYGLSTGDVIDIAAAFFSSKNANEIYKSGVEYALKNNDSLTDKNMRNAVNVVLNTYEGGIPRAATAVSQLVMTISTGKANQEVKVFLKGTAGYNSAICKAVKLALDELFSMKELTNAVEQSVAAREFQLLACDSFRSAAAKVQEGKYSEEDLLTV